jgi:stage IV sporulation protein A
LEMISQVTDIYESIAQRTDGNIYIGVVGPVRTGKSTFIKRFMQTLVLPRMENGFRRTSCHKAALVAPS